MANEGGPEAECGQDNGEMEEVPKVTPEMIWGNDNNKLGDFEVDSNLPTVCRFCEDSSRGAIPPGLKIHSEQPVMFYTRCKKKQVKARTIFKDSSGNYYEVGQTLLLPEDFDGRFELVPPDFSRGLYCHQIAEIAKVMPKKFFTRTKIHGIRVTQSEEDEQMFLERKIPAGSVLRVSSTFAAKWRTCAETMHGLIKKKKQKNEWVTHEMKYLKCLDRDDEEVLVPFNCKGKFNIVYEKGINDRRTIFRLKDILDEFPLPVKVRLIFGKAPVVPCIFTGMLVLKSDTTEESIVGSTVLNRRNVLFELPLNLPCKVQTVENEESYSERKTFHDAKKLCHKYALSYASLIKLSPDMDTEQQMVLHIPEAKTKVADNTLKTIDMVTNMSLTDEEPRDAFMDSNTNSDTDSIQSTEMNFIPRGNLLELREIREMKFDNAQTLC